MSKANKFQDFTPIANKEFEMCTRTFGNPTYNFAQRTSTPPASVLNRIFFYLMSFQKNANLLKIQLTSVNQVVPCILEVGIAYQLCALLVLSFYYLLLCFIILLFFNVIFKKWY